LIPDLASLRDRARSRWGRRIFGCFALGWRGSSRQWRCYEAYYPAMAALGVPLVVSVHSVVGMDFAVGLMPGWQETIFPAYFVVGAMFSGFAMVATLAVPIRSGLHLEAVITHRHFAVIANILLLGGTVMGLSYVTEWFIAWYSGEEAERGLTLFQFAGPRAFWYWLMFACNVVVPQVFWLPAARRSIPVIFVAAILINVGMWLERLLIVTNPPSHGFLPASWQLYVPTVWDWLLLAGSLGFFAFLFLVLARMVPLVSIHELRSLARETAR